MAGAITLSESNSETRIEWKINNFFTREDNLIISPEFMLFNSKWFFQIHLGSNFLLPLPQPDNVFREPLRMSLLTPNSATEHRIEYRMGIRRPDGSEIGTEKFETVLQAGFSQTPQRCELISRKDLETSRNTLAPENILTVFCTVRLLSTVKPAENVSSTYGNIFSPFLIFYDERKMEGKITLNESNNNARVEWKISNILNRGENLMSPSFILFESKWCLRIRQVKKHSELFSQLGEFSEVSLYVCIIGENVRNEHHIEYRMGIQKPDGSEITTEKLEAIIKTPNDEMEHELLSVKELQSLRDTATHDRTVSVFFTVRLLSNTNADGGAKSPIILYGNLLKEPSYFHDNEVGKITLGKSKNETRVEWMVDNFIFRNFIIMTSPNFNIFESNWHLEMYKKTVNVLSFSNQGEVSKETILMSLWRDYSTIEHHIEYRMGIQKPDGSEIITEKFESIIQSRFRKIPQDREVISDKDLESIKHTLTQEQQSLVVFCAVRLLDDDGPSENILSPNSSAYDSATLCENSKSIGLTESIPTLSESVKDLHLTKDISTQTESSGTSWLPKGIFKFGEGSKGYVTSSESSKDVYLGKGIRTLSKSFEDLYHSKRFTDVTITVKNKEYLAHKVILSSRSDVFASMFEHDTSEENSIVNIIDCDPHSFENFILYLYTGKLDVVSSSNAVSLFNTADKHGLDELKDECVKCMTDTMTVDSFCDVFRLAALNGESDLLSTATNFFIRNANAILITKEWLTLLQDQASLCNELLVKFAKNSVGLPGSRNRRTSSSITRVSLPVKRIFRKIN